MNDGVVRIFKRSEGFPEEVVTELRSKEKVELVEQREEERHFDREQMCKGPMA